MKQIEIISNQTIIDVNAETATAEVLVYDYSDQLIEQFALQAQQSAQDAEDSADNASDSANSANASATTATNQAIIATNQALLASAARLNAQNSANSALSSANSASQSASSALVSATSAELDAIATGADRVQTGLDRQATGADRVQTGLDRQATGADRVQTGVDATTATTQAGIATTKANEANQSASTATTQAGIATTQAGIATTQAGIATTKAQEANQSASDALASEQASAQSASDALQSEQNALASEQASALSEANALASEQSASASASTATAQAGIATTQAGIATAAAASIVPVTIGTPANGLSIDSNQVLSIGLASGSTNGALSSTDWTTFNAKQPAIGYTPENVANKAINLTSPDDTKYPTTLAVSTALAGKQNTLTNPITGTGASGQVAFWSGTGTQTGDSGLTWNNVDKTLTLLRDSANVAIVLQRTGSLSGSASIAIEGTAVLRISPGTMANLNIPHGSVTSTFSGLGRLGVATNAPTQTLDVNGTGRIRNGVSLADTSGNVQIGTLTDAGFRLDVNGTARVQGELTVNGVQIGLGGGAISTNTRVGWNALNANTSAGNITAIGRDALFSNTTGTSNTAVGQNSLRNNTTGDTNSALGATSLRDNTTGFGNASLGSGSLLTNTTGFNNTGIGVNALRGKITGSNNTGTGANSGRFIADGLTEVTIANNSVFIGSDSRALADNQTNQIVIGHTAIGLGSNTTVIGNSSTTFGRWWGRLLIGTSTDAGFGLDVNGTARVQGSVTLGTVGTGTGFSWDNTNNRLGLRGIASPVGALDINTGGSNLSNVIGQLDGSISFGNISSSSQVPAILGKSTNLTGLTLFGLTANSNTSGDLILAVRDRTNDDFTTLTNPAFIFKRFGTDLVTILRNGSVGIRTSPNASALVDLSSTTQGFLPPRMTSTQRDAIATPATGLVVYNTTDNRLSVYNGTAWVNLATV